LKYLFIFSINSITFHVNDKVYYQNHLGKEIFNFFCFVSLYKKKIFYLAIVRFIGTTLFAEGIWIGIEFLSRSLGKNDGSVNGHAYFQCKQNHGLFIRPNRITLTKT
jgi:dynactin complex subunit